MGKNPVVAVIAVIVLVVAVILIVKSVTRRDVPEAGLATWVGGVARAASARLNKMTDTRMTMRYCIFRPTLQPHSLAGD